MIITRAKLVELARREAEARAASGDLVSAYLVGSVAYGEPLLGGTADIDLVLIHAEDPATDREIVPLSADVHLDIVHHGRQRYAQPRGLRIDPWLGPAISGPVFLYDPQHFFEWAQAGARGQFFRADHTLARARSLLQAARDRLPHPLPRASGAGHAARGGCRRRQRRRLARQELRRPGGASCSTSNDADRRSAGPRSAKG